MKKLLVGAAAVALCAGAVLLHGQESNHITGVARVIDGDTIVVDHTPIRIFGIDAPEQSQKCRARNGVSYECGQQSTAAMSELTRDKKVDCEPRDRDRYGRTVAICRIEGVDLGAEMVRGGHATDYEHYSHGRYATQQAEAKAAHLGIWAGEFTIPSEWRQEHRR